MVSKPTTATTTLQRYSGVHVGSFRAALSVMPRDAVQALVEDAQARGVCIAVILADFYAQHHGEAQ